MAKVELSHNAKFKVLKTTVEKGGKVIYLQYMGPGGAIQKPDIAKEAQAILKLGERLRAAEK